jgi:molecular chaperone DnaJ
LTVAEVPATRAMLGGAVTVPTLDGDSEVEIPAGSQPGEQVVLKGMGLPSLRGTRRGDQRVVLDVFVPGRLSKEQRELARALDEALGPEGGRRDGRPRFRRRARRGR